MSYQQGHGDALADKEILREENRELRAEIARLQDENERLREAIRRLAEQDATLSVCDGNVTVDMDATLTEAERDSVWFAISVLEDELNGTYKRHTDTLRELMERTKNG